MAGEAAMPSTSEAEAEAVPATAEVLPTIGDKAVPITAEVLRTIGVTMAATTLAERHQQFEQAHACKEQGH